jgi:hypothetical protein
LDQSCTAHEDENIGEMEQGKEEKTQRIFASNETELSHRWRRRALLDSQLSSLNPQLSQYNGQRLAASPG